MKQKNLLQPEFKKSKNIFETGFGLQPNFWNLNSMLNMKNVQHIRILANIRFAKSLLFKLLYIINKNVMRPVIMPTLTMTED